MHYISVLVTSNSEFKLKISSELIQDMFAQDLLHKILCIQPSICWWWLW